MDKRLVLAVGLSAVVLIVFQTLFAPEPPVKTPLPDPSVETQAPSGSSTDPVRNPAAPSYSAEEEARPESAPAGTAFDAAADEETFEYTTETLRVVFSNRGGRVLSVELLGFPGPVRTSPVQLVRDPSGELSTRIESPSGTLDFGETLFSAREETGSGGARRIVFDARDDAGLSVKKTYTLPATGYLLDLDVQIEGAEAGAAHVIVWRGGVPHGEAGDKLYDQSAGTIALLGKDRETLRPGSFKKEPWKEVQGTVGWAGVRNKYFAAIIIPPQEASSRIIATGDPVRKITGVEIPIPILSGSTAQSFHLYLGPLEHGRLKAHGYGLDGAVDLGWNVFRPLSSSLLTAMTWMYGFIPNYGIIIILISVLTKILFYPLTKSSLRSMRKMQELQPQMTALRDKYKKDPQKMQAETMALYKQHKVNPLGGCLPMLVQMPVFFALYSVLSNSIAMRGAPFFLWMNDLSVPETLFSLGPIPVHVLPIIMFGTSLLQAKLTPTGADPRQKMMGYMMPAVLLFIFYSFPAGLNLYWTVNNILQVGQQWMIHREFPTPAATPTTTTA